MGENEMTKPTIDEQIAWLDRPHGVGNSLPDSYKASIRASLERLKAIDAVKVPKYPQVDRISEFQALGIMHNYASTLRDLLKRETEECQRQTRENFRLARLHEEAERQLAAMKSAESYQVYVNR